MAVLKKDGPIPKKLLDVIPTRLLYYYGAFLRMQYFNARKIYKGGIKHAYI